MKRLKKTPLPPHKITSVWGSDIPAPNKTFGLDRKLNWHFVEWLKRADINESNEFDWIEDVKPFHHKFFDVYFCDDMEWDEEECVGNGSSYFIKIPFDDYNKILHNSQTVSKGNVIIGLGLHPTVASNVVRWMSDSGMIGPDDVDEVQDVNEITKEEFCRVVGIDNPDICYDTGQRDMFGGVKYPPGE